MSHCHSEHTSHGGHDGHDHGHDHDHDHDHDHSDDVTPALQNLLYEQIDFSALTTLNEAAPRSGAAIVQKTWAQRLDLEPELVSDADEQLLMTVPFTGQVRLHSVLLRTSDSPAAPRTLHLHPNRDDLDFATATDLRPAQTLALARTSEVQEHPVKRALFGTTRSLALFFEDNFAAEGGGGGGTGSDEDEGEVTRLSYLAFKGEFMRLSKEPVSFLYEAAANPADHKAVVGTKGAVGSELGGAGGRDGT